MRIKSLHFLLSDFDLLLLLLLELDLFFFLRDDVTDDVGDRGLLRTVEDCVMISLLNSEKKSSIGIKRVRVSMVEKIHYLWKNGLLQYDVYFLHGSNW